MRSPMWVLSVVLTLALSVALAVAFKLQDWTLMIALAVCWGTAIALMNLSGKAGRK